MGMFTISPMLGPHHTGPWNRIVKSNMLISLYWASATKKKCFIPLPWDRDVDVAFIDHEAMALVCEVSIDIYVESEIP